MQKIKVLGIEYKIYFTNEGKEPRIKNVWGFCDFHTREIMIRDDIEKEGEDTCKNLVDFKKKVLRHEIIHAFLYESGLRENSKSSMAWAENEEMVDWIAIQFPKILEVYKKLGIEK